MRGLALWKRWGLRTQLAAVVTLAVLVAEALIAPTLVTRGSDALRREILASSRDAADHVADYTSVYADGAERAVRSLASSPDLLEAMQLDTPEEQVQDLQRVLQINSALDSIGIIDARGIVRVSGDPDSPALGTSNADRDYFRAAMATGQPSLGAPVLSRGTGRAIVPYGAPILDGTRTLGIVAGGISTLGLAEAVAEESANRAGQVLLADRRGEGVILAHSDPTLVFGRPALRPEVLKPFLSGGFASAETQTPDGAPVVVGYAPVRGFPWSVLAQEPLEAALSPVADRNWSDLVLVAVSILVALGLGGLTALRISAPIIRLRDAANGLAAGDLSYRVNFTQRDEIGDLGRAFDAMATSLEQRALLEAANRELEELNRRAQEASRLKSEFLANMSHELRTPLNGIIGFAQLMHDEKVGPVSADHKEYLSDILTSSEHLLALINDILDLAKVESGKMDFSPEPVDLVQIVGEVRDVLRSMAGGKQIQVDMEIDPTVRSVVADAGRVKQILYNYLSNALKFTPVEGCITIRVQPEGSDQYRLEVEDTGIGIEPDDVPRLFVEFQQLDVTAAKKFQGTGLGLALTKRIAEAQGGSVGVQSTPGVGSTFFAILPRVMRAVDDDTTLPGIPAQNEV